MAEINDLSTTDASNTARFPENQAPSTVNDGARALEGLIARGLKDTIDGALTTGGTSTAYTLTPNRTISAYYAGLTFAVKFHTASGASPTVNVSSLGAKSITWPNGTAIAANEIATSARGLIQYDGTNFQILTIGAAPFSDPTTTRGDLIVRGASNIGRIAVGTTAQVLKGGTDPSFGSVDGTMIRMGSDAQGDVLYYNGTNYVRLGAGTSGHVLKTQGAGANPVWQSSGVPSGGSSGQYLKKSSASDWDTAWDTLSGSPLVVISTQSASGASTVDFANLLSATYDTYILEGENIVTSSGAATIGVQLGYGGTPTYTAASYGYSSRCWDDSGTTDSAANSNAAATSFRVNIASGGISPDGAAESGSFTFIVSSVNSTARSKHANWVVVTATDQRRVEHGGGACQDATSQSNAVNSLRVMLSTGTISGNFTLYGRKRS